MSGCHDKILKCYCPCHHSWFTITSEPCLCNCRNVIQNSNTTVQIIPQVGPQDLFSPIWDKLKKLEDRLDKLESDNKKLFAHYDANILKKCFMNEKYTEFEDKLDKLESKSSDKKPFKCPVCEGKFIYEKGNPKNIKGIPCRTCDGKGIVWS